MIKTLSAGMPALPRNEGSEDQYEIQGLNNTIRGDNLSISGLRILSVLRAAATSILNGIANRQSGSRQASDVSSVKSIISISMPSNHHFGKTVASRVTKIFDTSKATVKD